MPITHQIVDKDPNAEGSDGTAPGGDIASQLSGLIAQAQGLLGGSGGLSGGSGVGLSAIQGIGSQISALGTTTADGANPIMDAGGTSTIAGAIASLGQQMFAGNMAGMSGLLTSLTGQLSGLTSMLNPTGSKSQVLHKHFLEKAKGILHSAFQGKHTVALGSGGIDFTSANKIASSAPMIPHNGLTTVSDSLQVSKGIFGQAFGMLSDRRLKRKIDDHPKVLEKIMSLKLKTFEIQTMDWENEQPLADYRPSFGLIAQEVQQVLPQLVTEGKYLTIEESKVGLLLLAAFQEFVIEVREELKKR